jgi:glycine/D-amino acid oxidase-like deaminating enzyme
VAYEAARAGAAVTLVDKSLPGSGVTGDSFGWIGGPRGTDVPDASRPLRDRVVAEYRRLERELPGLGVRWSGSLSWEEDVPASPARLAADERVVDAAQVSRWEPHLAVPPERAVHKADDGAVDPVTATDALVRAARGHGARLLSGTAVTALRVEDRRAVGVDTSGGFVPCRTVVVAAGVDAPALVAPLGVHVPVSPSIALLLRVAGPPGLVRTLVAGSGLEVREAAEGVLLLAAAYDGELDQAELARAAERTLRRLTDTFTGAQDVRLLGVRAGARPMPADGLPLVGPLPGTDGVHLAVMHSGVSLAPVVGRLVAAEVVGGDRAAELEGVRPERLVGDVRG